jgi:hypothetical protein
MIACHSLISCPATFPVPVAMPDPSVVPGGGRTPREWAPTLDCPTSSPQMMTMLGLYPFAPSPSPSARAGPPPAALLR